MDTIQISNISIDELKELIKSSLQEIRSDIPAQNSDDRKEKYATRKEVAAALHISLPTLNELTKTGVIPAYRLNGRVLYKWSELEKSLKKVETLKYRRVQ